MYVYIYNIYIQYITVYCAPMFTSSYKAIIAINGGSTLFKVSLFTLSLSLSFNISLYICMYIYIIYVYMSVCVCVYIYIYNIYIYISSLPSKFFNLIVLWVVLMHSFNILGNLWCMHLTVIIWGFNLQCSSNSFSNDWFSFIMC